MGLRRLLRGLCGDVRVCTLALAPCTRIPVHLVCACCVVCSVFVKRPGGALTPWALYRRELFDAAAWFRSPVGGGKLSAR